MSEKLLMNRKFKVLDGIKLMLTRLDLTNEVPNSTEFEQICDLLEDLKGSPLTAEERELVTEIIEHEYGKNRR